MEILQHWNTLTAFLPRAALNGSVLKYYNMGALPPRRHSIIDEGKILVRRGVFPAPHHNTRLRMKVKRNERRGRGRSGGKRGKGYLRSIMVQLAELLIGTFGKNVFLKKCSWDPGVPIGSKNTLFFKEYCRFFTCVLQSLRYECDIRQFWRKFVFKRD